MVTESFENRGQGNGEDPKELRKPEIVGKDVSSFEFRRGIAFNERPEADKALGELPDGPPFDQIIVDQTQQPPLYILMPSLIGSEEGIAKRLGKERGYNSSYVGIVLQLNPTTKNLQVDFDQTVSTLREAGISTTVSGQMLIEQVERIIKEEASIQDIGDEDDRREAYAEFKKRKNVLLAQQEGLDVYLELGNEIERRLFYFKSGDDLDISRTTLVVPLLSNNHPQASHEVDRIKFGMIMPAIDIIIAPSSKEGKIDDTPPNFDPQTLAAGRDLTARIKTAFEALKPKA